MKRLCITGKLYHLDRKQLAELYRALRQLELDSYSGREHEADPKHFNAECAKRVVSVDGLPKAREFVEVALMKVEDAYADVTNKRTTVGAWIWDYSRAHERVMPLLKKFQVVA